MDDAGATLLDQVERDAPASAFHHILTDVAGKRVLFWMLEQCAIYQDAFTGDDAATNYTLGRQASGRKLIAKLDEINPRFYPQLLIDIAEIKDRDRSAAISQSSDIEDEDDAP